MRRFFTLAALGCILAASAGGLIACEAVDRPPSVGGYATTYAKDVPPGIYGSPHVWCDGGYAYLVGDRWYFPAGTRWVVLRQEPPELYRYRTTYRAPMSL
jgi:hypothetical protein